MTDQLKVLVDAYVEAGIRWAQVSNKRVIYPEGYKVKDERDATEVALLIYCIDLYYKDDEWKVRRGLD